MYQAMVLALAVLAGGALLARSRPRAGGMVAACGLTAALLFGALHVHGRRARSSPVLGHWADDEVATRLAAAVVRDVPRGGAVLLLRWSDDAQAPRVQALLRLLGAAGLAVTAEAPPPQVPTGRSNEVMRITLEEGGVPPSYLAEVFRRHPESRAIVALLNFTGAVPAPSLAGLPPLFLDETASRFFDVPALIRTGAVGAAIRRRPASAWSADDALAAGPGGAFDLRFELLTRAPREASR